MAREPAAHFQPGVTHPCAAGLEVCGASFTSGSKWDDIRAHSEGWFSRQRDGLWWCPAHVPGWVPAWRARQAAKKAAGSG